VVASDGLWELLSNQRVAEIVNGFYSNNDIEGCVNALIDESSNKWIEVFLFIKLET
jgi:serine/threonine protein phosphatase PrpC